MIWTAEIARRKVFIEFLCEHWARVFIFLFFRPNFVWIILHECWKAQTSVAYKGYQYFRFIEKWGNGAIFHSRLLSSLVEKNPVFFSGRFFYKWANLTRSYGDLEKWRRNAPRLPHTQQDNQCLVNDEIRKWHEYETFSFFIKNLLFSNVNLHIIQFVTIS